MKKILLLVAVVLAAAACKQDNPDTGNSIFDTSSPERNSFDEWLLNNYTLPYNIKVFYRMRDIEVDYNYNLTPARIDKAKQMAWVIKYMWLEPYEVVANDGVHFIRKNVPRVFHFIGSAHYNTNGTITMGTAEGGGKITIAEVNVLDPSNIMAQRVLNTIHHEYAHILHQTIPYDVEFGKLSAANYNSSNWNNKTDAEAAGQGFISRYAGAAPSEDFVENIARYLTYTDAQWDAWMELAGEEGRRLIEQKHEIVMSYMRITWGVDLDALRQEVQNRAADLALMDFDEIIDF